MVGRARPRHAGVEMGKRRTAGLPFFPVGTVLFIQVSIRSERESSVQRDLVGIGVGTGEAVVIQ